MQASTWKEFGEAGLKPNLPFYNLGDPMISAMDTY